MKVFVTGGAGYIGSVTTEMLLDAGHEVVVFDNLERGHRRAVDGRARFVRGDLRDWDRIRKALRDVRPDSVMHFAAYALVSESSEKPEMYFRNNVIGSVNLAEAMLRAGVRLIVFSSSCATYGEPERVPIKEEAPQRPSNPYGETKLAAERMLEWYSRIHGFTAVFLRYFNACGATASHGEDHEPETHLIPIVLRAAMGQRKAVTIHGGDYPTPDGTCVRDYIHIVDLARAHVLGLRCAKTEAFNLGTGRGYSVREVLDTAREVTGRRIPARIGPRRRGDPPRLVASPEKANRSLKWKPRASDLETIIRSAWEWHQAHPRGYGGRKPGAAGRT